MNELVLPIVDLLPDNASAIEQCATLLYEVFMEHHPAAWPDMASARREVGEFFAEGRISRIAVESDGTVIGWVGAIRAYDGFAWELAPAGGEAGAARGEALAGGWSPTSRTGCGSAAASRSGWAPTTRTTRRPLGESSCTTTCFGHLARIRNLNGHPYEFYRKVGFTIVGAAGRERLRQAGHLHGKAGGVGELGRPGLRLAPQ